MNSDYLKDTYKLDDRVIDHIHELTANDQEFSDTRFEKWLKEKNVAFKSNPSAYVYKYFATLYQSGLFSRVEYVPNIQTLFNNMRSKGILVKQDDCLYIDILFQYLVAGNFFEEAEIIELSNKAIDYLKLHYPYPTSTQYIDVFKKSRKLKSKNIDYELIEKKYQDENAKWDGILDELKIMEIKNGN